MKKIISLWIIVIVIGILAFVGFSFFNKNNKELASHNITKVTENKEIKSDEGITLINVKYSYPIIENTENNEFINDINKEYKLYSENFLSQANLDKVDAQSLYEVSKNEFMPHSRELDYDIKLNKNGLLSITNRTSYYSGGAHGLYSTESKTFNLRNKEELTLDKIINNDVWNIHDLRKNFKVMI